MDSSDVPVRRISNEEPAALPGCWTFAGWHWYPGVVAQVSMCLLIPQPLSSEFLFELEIICWKFGFTKLKYEFDAEVLDGYLGIWYPFLW